MPKRHRKRAGSVREPVQVYLDEQDRDILESLVERSSLSRAELLRLGLRRLSDEMLTERKPGTSLATLVGALDAAPSVPEDLAARHDAYLYDDDDKGEPRRD
jgi:hypothetical protein